MLYKISENPVEVSQHINALKAAIAFSVVLSSWEQLQSAISTNESLSFIGQSVDFNSVMMNASFRACDWTCKFAADYIHRNFPHLFPAAYQAVGTQGRGKNIIYRDPKVEAHIYMIAVSQERFYGISPNNYFTPKPDIGKRQNKFPIPPNPYDSIFIADSIHAVLAEIEANEGGVWRLGDVPYYILGSEDNISRFSIDKSFNEDEIFEAEQKIPIMQVQLSQLISTGKIS